VAQRKMGTAFVHTVLDDHSRVAYAEIHDDESAATATAVLRNAVAWFAERGVNTVRVLSDNGSCYRSFLWRDICLGLGITHKGTRPCRPQTNGKIERFHPGRGLGVQAHLQLRNHPQESPARMDPRVQPPPAPHRNREVNANQPLDQPLRSVQLEKFPRQM